MTEKLDPPFDLMGGKQVWHRGTKKNGITYGCNPWVWCKGRWWVRVLVGPANRAYSVREWTVEAVLFEKPAPRLR